MKIFVATRPPLDVRATLAGVMSDWDLPGTVVPADNWHVTLRFIGRMGETSTDRLLAELDQVDLGGRFDATLGGLGTFPKASKASVLWLGLGRGGEQMTELAETVDRAVDRIGAGAEDRPFVPHLTLARIRPPEDVRRLIEDIEVPPIPMPVDEIVVFSSVTAAGGPIYHPIESFSL